MYVMCDLFNVWCMLCALHVMCDVLRCDVLRCDVWKVWCMKGAMYEMFDVINEWCM